MKNSEKKKGRLIVFEGPDGVGKTSLTKRLVKELELQNQKCIYFSFPGRIENTLGELVYKIHHNILSNFKNITPAALQTLHIAAHIDTIENQIKPLLEQGYVIILDRFWWSTFVYGRCSKINNKMLTNLINVEKGAWGSLKPDMLFLINRDRPFQNESDKWPSLKNEYLELAKTEKNNYPIEIFCNSKDYESSIQNLLIIIQNKVLNLPKSFVIYSKLAPAKSTKIMDAYWRFAAERQEIFFKRVWNLSPPWTEDPVLKQYKFTNAYRAADRVSQYLIKEIIYNGDQGIEEIFFRIILFKLFNKIATWKYLESNLGQITYSSYSFDRFDKLLSDAQLEGTAIYSSAYIMPSGSSTFGYSKKHRNHLKLIERMMEDNLSNKIVECRSMQQVFNLLLSYPTLGKFLAYQLTIDLNYSILTDFSEMEFVIPGPGALDGIQKCFTDFGGLNEIEIIKLVTDKQQDEFERLGVEFKSLWGRPLQLIDCQNIFCEIDKYSRVAFPSFTGKSGRTKIKHKYLPTSNAITTWYPPKWHLNEKISQETVNAIL
jgi:thymidylate kinase